MAEIVGRPEVGTAGVLRRRLTDLDHLEREGTRVLCRQVAAIETRDRKEPIDLLACATKWRRAQPSTASVARELKRLLGRTVTRELNEHEVAEVATQLVGPEGLTEKRSTFSGP